mmetsp:Transcript_8640/g.19260  ORF Transcript_8640/g.19260 Transcript_8640/m.19260 type:complete len:541 (-) Transcript_8640:119-1741(-)
MGKGPSKPTAERESSMEYLEEKVGRVALNGRYHRLPRRIEDDYEILNKVLGRGAFSVVKQAMAKGGSTSYAVKALPTKSLSRESKAQLEVEVDVCLGMDHRHVVRLFDVYEAEHYLHLVMECMEGGELYDRVRERRRFSESDAAAAVHQMLLAVNYLHQQGIAHRDLKLENFLYESEHSDHLKLIDFGFSHVWDMNTKMRLSCGTLAYVAPEVLMKSYTPQCDMWSLGVITWVLLVGYMPFSGSDRVQIEAIKKGNYRVKREVWSKVSPSATEFVFGLLKLNPDERFTAERALAHEWIQDRNSLHYEQRGHHLADESLLTAFETYARQSQFKRAALSMMAWSLRAEERALVRDAFVAMDADHTGTVKLSALKAILVDNFDVPDEKISSIVQALDSNNDEELNYSEFLAAMLSSRIEMHDDLLVGAFRRFDTNGSGYITVADLKLVLGESFDGATVEELLQEADISGDGKISPEEFVAYLKDTSGDAHSRRQVAAQKIIDDELSVSSGSNGKWESPLKIRRRTKQAFNTLKEKVMTATRSM